MSLCWGIFTWPKKHNRWNLWKTFSGDFIYVSISTFTIKDNFPDTFKPKYYLLITPPPCLVILCAADDALQTRQERNKKKQKTEIYTPVSTFTKQCSVLFLCFFSTRRVENIIIWVRDLPGGQIIMKKKSSLEESNVKLTETSFSPSTNPWSILTKIVVHLLSYILFQFWSYYFGLVKQPHYII